MVQSCTDKVGEHLQNMFGGGGGEGECMIGVVLGDGELTSKRSPETGSLRLP